MHRHPLGWGLGVLLLAAHATGPAHAQEIPSSQTFFVVTGSVPNARVGSVVGPAGDANGDGRDDLLVGSDSLLTVYSGATGQPLYAIPADRPGDFDHATVLTVNDLDGDGRSDLVVAAPMADQEGQPDAGAVLLISGAGGQRIRTIPGPGGGHFGASAALLGDLSGDGVADLLVGAPGGAPRGLAEAGSVSIVSLTNGAILRTFIGTTAGGHLGAGVAALGDISGDGRPDFAVSAPGRDVEGIAKAGLVFFVSASDGRTLTPQPLRGAQPNTQLGASMASAGDLDGDGRVDLILGAPTRAVADRAAAGVVFVYSVATGRTLYRLEGAGAGDGFGAIVAGGADVNGDGRPDILVGTPTATVEGRSAAGLVQVYSGPDGKLLLALAGNAGDQLGAAAAFAGDASADGHADVIAGAPFFHALAAPDIGIAAVVGLPGTAPPGGNGDHGGNEPTGPNGPL